MWALISPNSVHPAISVPTSRRRSACIDSVIRLVTSHTPPKISDASR